MSDHAPLSLHVPEPEVRPGGTPDFVDQLLVEGAATPQAKVRDVLIALKDRLLGEPTLGTSESALAAALIEAPLDAPVSSLGAAQQTHVRRFCGVLLASPQMLLQGLAAEPVTTFWFVPALATGAALAVVAVTVTVAAVLLTLPSLTTSDAT